MGFTTPCFICKNTPELWKKLEKLGYREYGNPFQITDNSKLITTIDGEYVPYNVLLDDSFIDCDVNEELFLAIAALRDDTDNNQLFTNGKGDWGIYWDGSDGGLSGMDFYGMPNDFEIDNYHKATVNELIEYFKTKDEV